MTRQSITIDDAVALLNEMVALDTPAIAALVANRVPCNEAIAEHPTIQVNSQHGGWNVGLLGVINGLFGIDEHMYGAIEMVWETDEKSSGGNRLIGFRKRE